MNKKKIPPLDDIAFFNRQRHSPLLFFYLFLILFWLELSDSFNTHAKKGRNNNNRQIKRNERTNEEMMELNRQLTQIGCDGIECYFISGKKTAKFKRKNIRRLFNWNCWFLFGLSCLMSSFIFVGSSLNERFYWRFWFVVDLLRGRQSSSGAEIPSWQFLTSVVWLPLVVDIDRFDCYHPGHSFSPA